MFEPGCGWRPRVRGRRRLRDRAGSAPRGALRRREGSRLASTAQPARPRSDFPGHFARRGQFRRRGGNRVPSCGCGRGALLADGTALARRSAPGNLSTAGRVEPWSKTRCVPAAQDTTRSRIRARSRDPFVPRTRGLQPQPGSNMDRSCFRCFAGPPMAWSQRRSVARWL